MPHFSLKKLDLVQGKQTSQNMTRQDLLQSKEYWLVQIQTDLYNHVRQYLEQNNMTQTEFADKLGVTKGYISQIMNGNFNHSLAKLIEISLAIGKVPSMNFENIETVIYSNSSINVEESSNFSELSLYKKASLVA